MQKNWFPGDHEDPLNLICFSKLKSEVVRYFSKWFLNKWWMEDAVEIAVARLPGRSSIQASNNLKQFPSARKRCLWKNQSVETLPELWFSGKRIPPSHNHFLYTRIIFKFSWFWHHGNVLIFPTLRLVCCLLLEGKILRVKFKKSSTSKFLEVFRCGFPGPTLCWWHLMWGSRI